MIDLETRVAARRHQLREREVYRLCETELAEAMAKDFAAINAERPPLPPPARPFLNELQTMAQVAFAGARLYALALVASGVLLALVDAFR